MRRLRYGILALLAVAGAAQTTEADVSDSSLRGRALYCNGLHADGRPLIAVTAEAGIPLPAAFVACVKCHGYDGRGKTEGGVSASDIRWDTLTKPYELTRPDGRRRGPYDESLFFAAVTRGVDSSGLSLNPAMPRYQLSIKEAADVLAYLGQIGRGTDGEGVTDGTIRIGLIGLSDSAFAASATADRRLLDAWCADVNRHGIFRRQIELVEIDASTVDFAPPVLAVLTAGEEAHALPLAKQWRIPILRLTAGPGGADNRYAFSLYPNMVERTHALVGYTLVHNQPAGPHHVALLYPAERAPRALLDSIAAANERDRFRQFGLLASAQLLLFALEKSGREVNREKLVETLASSTRMVQR